MAQKPKKDTSKPQQNSFSKEQDNKKEKMIKLGVIFAFIIVLIILLVTFCHRKDYAVTFMVDGKEYRLENVHNMGEIVKPKEPTKEGYTFTGWYVGNKEFDFENGEITKDMQLEAHFAKNTYSITIDDGVNVPTEIKIEHGEKLEEPDVPTKDGYTFLGWYIGEDTFDFSNEITESAQIEARWAEIGNASYTVEHYLMGLDGKYSKPDKTEHKMGRIGSKVTPTTHTYKGFTTPTKETVTVLEDGETTVKYYYKRNKYKLTLNGDNGIESLKGEGTYYYKEKVNVEVTLKEGYDFAHWSNEQVNASFTYTIDKDTTLNATTTPIEYTITYELHGGAGDNPSTYTVEDSIVLKDPIKEGYTFKHWLVNGKEVEDFDSLLGDLKIEAVFEANTNTPYTVEHYYMNTDGNYPNTPSGKEEKVGTTDTSILKKTDRKVPEIGYEFDKEESTSSIIKGSGDSVVRYYYKRKKHTLTITGDKGVETPQSPSKESYLYGEEITLDSNNTIFEEGYEFSHWVLEGETNEDDTLTFEMKDADMTVEIKAKLTTYTLTYISKTNKEETLTDTFKMGDTLTAKEPTAWVGHHFDGWYSTSDFKEGTKYDFTKPMSAGNLTLYAKWVINHNTFTFESLNPDIPVKMDDIVQDFGTEIVKPQDPTYPGYTFDGWYDQTGTTKQDIPTTMPQEGMTFYAKWHANTYTVTFDANGGEGDMTPQDFTYDEASRSLTRNSFTKLGYHFVGWSTTSDNQKKVYDDEASIQNIAGKEKDKDNITLYAMWEANTYKVKYHGNNSTEGTDFEEEFTYDVEKELNKNESHFTKKGYHFLGWTSDKNSNTLINEKKNYTTGDAVDVYAVWEANTYTVTYDANKGKGSSDPKGEVEKTTHKYDTLDSLSKSSYTRDGYTFLGWSLEKHETSVDTCDDCIDKAHNLTSDKDGNVTLYAVWKMEDYTITYINSLGDSPTTQTYTYEEEVTISDPVNIEGYTFEGWYKEETGTGNRVSSIPKGSTDNITLYAKWKEHTYTVKYVNSDEGVTYKYTQNFSLQEVDNNKYQKYWTVTYQYNDSKTSSKTENRNLTYTAWRIQGTEKVYDAGSSVSRLTSEDEDTIILEPAWENPKLSENDLETPTRTGYKFSAWQLNGETVTKDTVVTDNIELMAKWNNNTYKVIYELGNGQPDIEKTFIYDGDNNITLGSNDISKDYEVTWKDGEETKTTSFSATFEHWQLKEKDQTYNANTKVMENLATGEEGDDTVRLVACWKNPTITLPTEEKKKTGYKFIGWYQDIEREETKAEDDDPLSSNLTLNAKWEPITYTVIFTDGSGSDSTHKYTYTYDGNNNIIPKRSTFDDFSKSFTITFKAADGVKVPDAISFKADIAQWKVRNDDKTYQVKNTDTTISENLTAEENATIYIDAVWSSSADIKNKVAEKKGYNFKYWKKADGTTPANSFTLNSNIELTAEMNPIHYKVKYPKMDGSNGTKSCTYDQECSLNDYKEVSSIEVKLYNDDQSVSPKSTVQEKAICKTSSGSSCEQDGMITVTDNSATVKNLAATEGSEVTVKPGLKVTFPDVEKIKEEKEDYVFGGWSKNVSSVKAEDILGYNLVDDKKADFTGQYEYAKEWIFTESTDLYAKWWDIPYISGASFNLVNLDSETDTKEAEIKTGHLPGKKKTTFYVKMPILERYYVNIFSLKVSVSQPVILNTKAKKTGGDIYSYLNANNVPSLGIGSLTTDIPFLPDDTKKTFNTDKNTIPEGGGILGLFESFKEQLNSLTFAALVNQFVGELGVTNQFGCNGLACSPHYASKLYYNINGSVYYFFGTDDAMEDAYTIEYWTKDELAYSIEVPHGSVIPDLGKDVTIYKVISMDQDIEKGNSYTVSGWETSDGKAVTFNDSNIADSSNSAYKNEDGKKKIILKAKDAVQKEA